MATPIIMPRQGQSVESCILTKWYKEAGDTVVKGELLFAYETDKASFEEEAAESGTLLACFFEDGDEVPVLVNIAAIGNEGEDFTSLQPNQDNDTHTEEVSEEVVEIEDTYIEENNTQLSLNENAQFSPRAKVIAAKYGIRANLLNGSGPKGRIIEKDVVRYLNSNPKITPLAKSKANAENLNYLGQGSGLGGNITSNDLTATQTSADGFNIVPLTNMRKLIAKAMYNSLQNSAQLTHHLSADARNILALRKEAKAAHQQDGKENITINDFVCYSVIKALDKFPEANAHFLGDSIKVFKNVNLGMAVSTERGLMVPAIPNANSYNIGELSSKLKESANQCKTGNINPDLLAAEAASFTISNLGNFGIEHFTPIINIPQACILGVNTIIPRPKDMGDGVYGFVPHIGLSLTYDHRAMDGADASLLLKQIAIEIETLKIEL